MRSFAVLGLFAGAMIASSANAIDIKKAKARPVEAEASSTKSLFDLERCIIEIDARDAPYVYRQPDRPADSTVVYAVSGIVYALINIHAEGGTTNVVMRSLSGIAGAKIAHGVEGCSA